MLIAKPTKYGAGMTLYGDFWDLRSLYETIHSLCPEGATHFNDDIKETILGLAYDIRHAYQRDREIETFGDDEYDKVQYLGVKILWPVLLFQINALRLSACFQPTNKEQQANIYRLENCVEKSLVEYDPKIGMQCIEWLNIPIFLTLDYLSSYVENISRRYIFSGQSGITRFRKLPELLQSYYPTSEEYKKYEINIKSIAKDHNCSPNEIHDNSEWPDFKW